jgi:hypothetical protein
VGFVTGKSLKGASYAAIKEIEFRLRDLSHLRAWLPGGHQDSDQCINKDLEVTFDGSARYARLPRDVAKREKLSVEDRSDAQESSEGGDVLYERLLTDLFLEIRSNIRF